MRKFILVVFLGFFINTKAQPPCGFDILHKKLLRNNLSYFNTVKLNNNLIKKYINDNTVQNRQRFSNTSSYIIPVVVHVMNTGGAIGTTYNPTDNQITDAINYLNQVYNGTFPGTSGVGDIGIQFALAKKTPNNECTDGIERINASSLPNYVDYGINADNNNGCPELTMKNTARWNPSKYYNIWLVNKIDGKDGTVAGQQFIAGFAYFPGVDQGLDGIVMLASQMKRGQKTLPHEIGHALNLYHPFEGSTNYLECPSNINCTDYGDHICDTDPISNNVENGIFDFTCRNGNNPCANTNFNSNTESNYMNYTNCYNLFTPNQKERMLAAMTLPSRNTLVQNNITLIEDCADLTITNQSISSNTVTAGNFTTVYFNEFNLGYGAASPHYVSFHLSTNDTLTPDNNGDFYVGEYFYNENISALSPTARLEKQILIPSNTLPGNYYLFFSADGNRDINESDELNNFATVQITVIAGTGCSAPIVTAPSSRIVIAPAGTSFSVSASGSGNTFQWQFNNGSGWANLSNSSPYSGVYSNTLSVSSTNQTMSGYRYRCNVTNSCDNTNSAAATLTVNTSTTSCNNDFACSPKPISINSTCVVTNCTTVGANPPSPGVIFTGCTGTPYQTGRYDDDVWFSITPTNTNPVTVKVTPTSNLTGFDPVLGIYTGACLSLTQTGCSDNAIGISEQITFTPVAGTTYLLRVFSYGMSSSNSGNFDICVTAPGSLSPTLMPDLIANNVWLSTSSICPGGSFQIDYDVENNGNASAGSSVVKFYLSSNSTYSVEDVTLGSSSIASLGSGYGISKTKTLNIPPGTSIGNWYVLIVVDANNNVDEGVNGEGNNVDSKGISVITCSLADIAMSYTGNPPTTGNVGQNVPVTYRCKNIGGSVTPPTKVGFYFSLDNFYDPLTDIFLNYETTAPLDQNEFDDEATAINIPDCLPCGNYFLIMVADFENLVSESDRENNIYAFPYTFTGCVPCSVTIASTGTSFQSAGGTGTIPVSAYKCCTWNATTDVNWININNPNGNGNGNVQFSVAPCSGGGSRSGTITVAGNTFTITQNCTEVCNNSYSFGWSIQAGSTNYHDFAKEMAFSNDGNLYLTGSIRGSAAFGNGIILNSTGNTNDIFVSKHNTSGIIQWAVSFGSSSQVEGANGIATDSDGYIYVIGYTDASISFGGTVISNNGTNNDAAFLVKLTPSGNVVWARKMNATNFSRPNSIKIDGSNNIFITGKYSELGTGDGFFITKYDPNGSQNWFNIYGMNIYTKEVYNITSDISGNLIICGRYMSTITLGSTTLTATNATLDTDGFIAKADGNGNILWARKITSPGQGTDELNSVTTDSANNIYVAGNIDSSAIVEGIIIPLSSTSKSIFIKYDPNGNPLWVKTSVQGRQENYSKVIVVNDNEIYLTGNFSQSLRIDSALVTSSGSNDNFMAKFDENGKLIWLTSYGGTNDEQSGGFVIDHTKNLYVSGSFRGSLTLGDNTISTPDRSDIYLAQFKQCDPPTASVNFAGNPIICPGQSISLSTDYCSTNSYQWALNGIDIPGATNANYTATQTGSYKVRVTASHACETLSNPVVLASQVTYTFNGNGDWSNAANWSNNMVPPSTLPSCAEIIINPQVGGECRLNFPQTISTGAKITVLTGSNFIIEGNLTIVN